MYFFEVINEKRKRTLADNFNNEACKSKECEDNILN